MSNKIDITSSALEKGLDLAKDFLDKLIIPAVEEAGLLLKDQVTYWKFKNQIKMLNKAKEYCEKNNISTKTISLKVLCPLLENAALEEDEVLQDKWAILLSNLVDSEQNIENHVFPYILGQISVNEFLFLENIYLDNKEKINKLTIDLEEFRINKPRIEEELQTQIEEFDLKIAEKKKEGKHPLSSEIWSLLKTRSDLTSKLHSLKYKEIGILRKISEPQVLVPEDELREFEISNLIRLGLIKLIQETYANPQTLEIPSNFDQEYLSIKLDVEVESNLEHIMTELGKLFIDACTDKSKKIPIKVV